MKTTLSISEARKNIFDIARDVQKPNQYYTLTENGRPKAVILSARDFESWQETLEVMRDFPSLDKDIKQTDRALATGVYKKWATLDDLLKKEGYVFADRSKQEYGVRTTAQTKRGKRTKKNR